MAGFGCAGGGPVSAVAAATATLIRERGGWSGVRFRAGLAAGDTADGTVRPLGAGALQRLVRLSWQV